MNVTASSFDGPATTDAALAALAAEAGLIDPKPIVKDESDELGESAEQNLIRQLEDNVEPSSTANEATTDEGTILFDNGLNLGLKGGSIIMPPPSFKFKLGLRGGSKETGEMPDAESSTIDSSSNNENITTPDENPSPLNGVDAEASLKMEIEDIKEEENSMEESGDPNMEVDLPSSFPPEEEEKKLEVKPSVPILEPTVFPTTTTPEETDSTGFVPSIDDIKKEEVDALSAIKKEEGDALSALASVALDHSKEIKKTENVTHVPESTNTKELWHTVGFIRGSSCDVVNYFMLEDYSGLTVDNLPDLASFSKIPLEPGTAYKFRVAAINSVGIGDWSEVRNFPVEFRFL